MSALRRAIDFSDGDVDGFLAYKERLIDYINRFIADLANSGAQIAVLLDEPGSRWPRAAAGARRAAGGGRRGSRGRGRRRGAGPGGKTGARRVAKPVARAGRLVHVAGRGAPVAGPAAAAGGSDRDQAAHRRGGPAQRAALGPVGPLGGLPCARPLVRRGAGRRGGPPPVAGGVRPVPRAAPVRHRRDRRRLAKTFHAGTAVARRTAHPDLAAAAEDRDLRAARQAQPGAGPVGGQGVPAQRRQNARRPRPLRPGGGCAPAGPTLLSDLDVLDPRAFRLFLALLGDALAARRPGDTEVKTVTSDGSLEVRLSPGPGRRDGHDPDRRRRAHRPGARHRDHGPGAHEDAHDPRRGTGAAPGRAPRPARQAAAGRRRRRRDARAGPAAPAGAARAG